MKGKAKALIASTMVALTLGGCSSFHEMQYSEKVLYPKWAEDCKPVGTEGFLFWSDEYAYSCGSGRSWDKAASEQQAKTFAVAGFAERINGTVNSSTIVDITDEGRNTRTFVEHKTEDTRINRHLEVKKFTFVLEGTGDFYTYHRYKLPMAVFNELLEENKNAKRNISTASRN